MPGVGGGLWGTCRVGVPLRWQRDTPEALFTPVPGRLVGTGPQAGGATVDSARGPCGRAGASAGGGAERAAAAVGALVSQCSFA